jgi:hypothetical protein
MPLHFCHPKTPHKKLKVPEWYISGLMMDRALDAVVRRAKKVDRKHDIPYLAGYSKDGKTIYIDRHMPRTLKYEGREIDTDRYLILHEEVEKTLIDQLDLHYLHAHQIASRAEQAAVRAAGIRWRDYDRFMQTYVKHIGDERLAKVPADLDLKPYRACSPPSNAAWHPPKSTPTASRAPSASTCRTSEIAGRRKRCGARSVDRQHGTIRPAATAKNCARFSMAANAAGSAPVIQTCAPSVSISTKSAARRPGSRWATTSSRSSTGAKPDISASRPACASTSPMSRAFCSPVEASAAGMPLAA